MHDSRAIYCVEILNVRDFLPTFFFFFNKEQLFICFYSFSFSVWSPQLYGQLIFELSFQHEWEKILSFLFFLLWCSSISQILCQILFPNQAQSDTGRLQTWLNDARYPQRSNTFHIHQNIFPLSPHYMCANLYMHNARWWNIHQGYKSNEVEIWPIQQPYLRRCLKTGCSSEAGYKVLNVSLATGLFFMS